MGSEREGEARNGSGYAMAMEETGGADPATVRGVGKDGPRDGEGGWGASVCPVFQSVSRQTTTVWC